MLRDEATMDLLHDDRPPTITVESKVGAVLELRFVGSPTLEEAIAFEERTAALVKRIVKRDGRRAILCTDLRRCGVLGPDASQRILKLMRQDNPHVERNAFLGSDSATLSLQVQRVIAEAGDSKRRRLFKSISPLISWLSDVARPAELARLRVFVADAG